MYIANKFDAIPGITASEFDRDGSWVFIQSNFR